MIAALIGTFVAAGLIGFCVGVTVVTKQQIRERLRALGFTENTAQLYARAAKILRRLDGLTDLDGDLAADILTPESKKQVSEWLADYRKGLDPK